MALNTPWTVPRRSTPRGVEERVRACVNLEEMIMILSDIARNKSRGETTRDRITAIKLILDRGWGQATQNVKLESDVPDAEPINVGALSREQRAQLESLLMIAAGECPPANTH